MSRLKLSLLLLASGPILAGIAYLWFLPSICSIAGVRADEAFGCLSIYVYGLAGILLVPFISGLALYVAELSKVVRRRLEKRATRRTRVIRDG